MNRKMFFKRIAGMLLLLGPAYTILYCSDSDYSSNDNNMGGNDPDCLANGASASNITSNHGHSLTVSSSDVNAGVEKTYNIVGSASHSHQVTVTASDFSVLRNNQQVILNSTNDNGHTHTVTISCA